jgi:hypothetical protein
MNLWIYMCSTQSSRLATLGLKASSAEALSTVSEPVAQFGFPPWALAILAVQFFLHFSITSAITHHEQRRALTGILLDELLFALGVMVGSSLVEHDKLLHCPGIGTVPLSGDLTVRLREEPVEVFVSIKPLVGSVHMSVDVVAFDRVDIETSWTEFPHFGDSYLGVELSSATY